MYGIKQKFNLKDYVEYYRSIDHKGQPCNEQLGYITRIEYAVNKKGDIELWYCISEEPVFNGSGIMVRPESVIGIINPRKEEKYYKDEDGNLRRKKHE